MEERERPQEAGWRESESSGTDRRVRRIVNASRAEASEIRYEAQEAARARLRAAELDAERCVEEAQRSSEELVLRRLRRLSELSKEIHRRYQGILEGLDGVEAAGGEARLLVDALGRAAQRLSQESGTPVEPTPIRPTSPSLAADASVDRVQ